MTASDLLEQPCSNKSDSLLLQAVIVIISSLFQTFYNNKEQEVRAELVDSREQICNNLFADM
jgi:hypothetical protein